MAKRLSGKGLEIGPLSNPIAPLAGLDAEYLDRYPLHELRRRFPELEHLTLTAPTVLGDAQRLTQIEHGCYDFLIAAHIIEHLRDPIGAVADWCRVVRPGGLIYLVVPDKRLTFDALRPRTPLEHLVLDYREPSEVRDREHYVEYATLVHRAYGDAAIAEAARLQAEDVSIHYHVFVPADVVALVQWVSEHVQRVTIVQPPVAGLVGREFHLLLRTEGAPSAPEGAGAAFASGRRVPAGRRESSSARS